MLFLGINLILPSIAQLPAASLCFTLAASDQERECDSRRQSVILDDNGGAGGIAVGGGLWCRSGRLVFLKVIVTVNGLGGSIAPAYLFLSDNRTIRLFW